MIIFIGCMVLFLIIVFSCIAYNGKDDQQPLPPGAFQGRWEERE